MRSPLSMLVARSGLMLLTLLPACPAVADEAMRVEFVPVQRATLTGTASLTGTIEPRDSVELGFPAGGRVVEVLVEVGDRVKAGDALARTNPLQQDQALRVAEAALASAEAAREQARQAETRAQAMLDRGVGTRAAADEARQALSQAAGAVERAGNSVEQARRAVEDTVLRAPSDAVVTARAAEPGQIVGPAQSVLTLASLAGVEAVFQVSDSLQLDRAMGVTVALHALDLNAPPMTGRVSEVSPLVDPRTGAVAVRVLIDNPPEGIDLLGAAVRGTVRYPDGTGIQLPWTALTRVGDQPAVWLVQPDGSVVAQIIEIARFVDGHVIVDAGLAPGQTVVGAGSQMLFPGRKVVAAAVVP